MNAEAYLKGYMTKEAGRGSTMAGMLLNPVNLATAPLGALAAGLTPTRSLEESSKSHAGGTAGVLKDLLIPGRAVYHGYKTMGSMNNHPNTAEIRKHLRRLNKDKARDDSRDLYDLATRVGEKVMGGTYHLEGNKHTMEAILALVAQQRKARGYDKKGEDS
jgi:hypothetical protein